MNRAWNSRDLFDGWFIVFSLNFLNFRIKTIQNSPIRRVRPWVLVVSLGALWATAVLNSLALLIEPNPLVFVMYVFLGMFFGGNLKKKTITLQSVSSLELWRAPCQTGRRLFRTKHRPCQRNSCHEPRNCRDSLEDNKDEHETCARKIMKHFVKN